MSITTVRVSNVSLGATEQDIKEFFSFSGAIEYIEMKSESERSQVAFVTFKDTQGADTAVLLSGATIVDQSIAIALEPDYVRPPSSTSENNMTTGAGAASAVQTAEAVVTGMLSKGYVLGKDAYTRAKSFDEKHQLTSTATAAVASLDQKIGLSNKISTGATIMNVKVKEMDEKFQVSEKTKVAFAAAEQTVGTAGSALMSNKYILTGTSWVSGAFSRVTKAAEEVGHKAMEKATEQQPQQQQQNGESGVLGGYVQVHRSESPKVVASTTENGASEKKPSDKDELSL